jgi:hypothetical protein
MSKASFATLTAASCGEKEALMMWFISASCKQKLSDFQFSETTTALITCAPAAAICDR